MAKTTEKDLRNEDLNETEASKDLEENLVEIRKETFRDFKWSEEEQEIIDFLKQKADDLIRSQFAQVYSQLNRIKNIVREKDESGNWKKDEYGGFVEDFTKLTPHDLDNALVTFSMLGIYMGGEVNDAYVEACIAKESHEDTYDEAWSKIIQGTQGDKAARARRDSRSQKYYSCFKSYYFFKIKDFRYSLKTLSDTLRFVRDQQSRDRSWAISGMTRENPK